MIAIVTLLQFLVYCSHFWPINAKWVNSHSFPDKDQDLLLLKLEAEELKFSSLFLNT